MRKEVGFKNEGPGMQEILSLNKKCYSMECAAGVNDYVNGVGCCSCGRRLDETHDLCCDFSVILQGGFEDGPRSGNEKWLRWSRAPGQNG